MKILFNAISLVLLLAFASCQQQAGETKVNLSATEVKQLLESEKNIVVLDVRTPSEFQAGHLDGAVNIDYKALDFEQVIAKLDTAATYLLYCASGNRSGKATAVMANRNFNHLYNSTVGFDALKSTGLKAK